MTKYEREILDIINMSNSHMTADEIFMKLREIEPHVVLATVYNNLNRLYEEGLIIKLSLGGQSERYDKNTPHDHLVCLKCGKISDHHFKDLTELFEKDLGMKIGGYSLKISYICPECQTNNTNL